MDYTEMMARLAHQRVAGVDMTPYAGSDGRIVARVCVCGFFRRDFPPGVYVCGCSRLLHSDASQERLMCSSCSEKIVAGRSSYATYIACEDCRTPSPLVALPSESS